LKTGREKVYSDFESLGVRNYEYGIFKNGGSFGQPLNANRFDDRFPASTD
jgi:hypothetical protein